MPGGDRTGPRGMGPMTGRAAGYCAGFAEPGYVDAGPTMGRGRGYRRGGGGGWGFGQGRGHRMGRRMGRPNLSPAYPAPASDQEKQMLLNQISDLQSELTAIKNRLGEIASGNEGKKAQDWQ